jgi:protein-L-isoaspartate O-methyltransferase
MQPNDSILISAGAEQPQITLVRQLREPGRAGRHDGVDKEIELIHQIESDD